MTNKKYPKASEQCFLVINLVEKIDLKKGAIELITKPENQVRLQKMMRIFSLKAFRNPNNSHIKKRIVTLTKGERICILRTLMRFDGICVHLKTMHSDDAKRKSP